MGACNVRNINEIVAELRVEMEKSIERARVYEQRYFDEKVLALELNRQAMAMLDAHGVAFEASHRNLVVTINFGYFKSTRGGNVALAEAVRRVRNALGCRLEDAGKDVSCAEKKMVEVTLKPVNYPDVRVKFSRRLPKTAKCRIVRHKSSYTSLVCSL